MRYLKLYERFIRENNTQTPGQAPSTTQTPGPAPTMPTGKPGQRFESTQLFKIVSEKLNDPEFQSLIGSEWKKLNEELKNADKKFIESLFSDGMDAVIGEIWNDMVDEMVKKNLLTSVEAEKAKEMEPGEAPSVGTGGNQRPVTEHPVNENLKNENLKRIAQDALKNLAILAAMAAAVKIFFYLGQEAFTLANQSGFSSVAGGVILILIYLAFFKKVKNDNSDLDNTAPTDEA